MVELREDEIDAAMAVMGCSPAYLALVAEALADAGGARGSTPSCPHELVTGDARGHGRAAAAAQAARRSASAVASPGGSTEAGLEALERGGLRGRIHRRRRTRRWSGCGERCSPRSAATTIADYVNALFIVYIILIFARILISWILARIPYNPTLRAVLDFVNETDRPLPEPLPPHHPADRRGVRARPQPDPRRSSCCSSRRASSSG